MSAPNNNSISAIGVPCTNRVRTPPPVIAHVATMAELHQDNRYGRFSNDVERLTGIRPMSVREFVQKNAHAFVPAVHSSAAE
jgi:hypothetical protein